jgi:hypothetical protein
MLVQSCDGIVLPLPLPVLKIVKGPTMRCICDTAYSLGTHDILM